VKFVNMIKPTIWVGALSKTLEVAIRKIEYAMFL